MSSRESLSDEERAIYEWQMWLPGFGEAGQRKLKAASVLVSRVGGLGGVVAYQLAAAGVGRLVLAHAGNVRPSDLNRQLLMTYDWIGKPRVESARRRLRELNPRVEIDVVDENITEDNVANLVETVDVIVDCAPRFEERFLMNREAVRRGKILVDCAMYGLEAQITTVAPGRTACLSCLYPSKPENWKREFPVFGASSGMVACLGVVEVIKVLSQVGTPLYGTLLLCDLAEMSFQKIQLQRNPTCRVCGQ